MSSRAPPTERVVIPPERLAEAGVWIARLHGDDRDPAIRDAFRRWLLQDALNARAFELVTEVWEDAEDLRLVVSFTRTARPKPTMRFAYFGAAVTALVVLFAVGIARYTRGDVFSTGIGEQRQVTLNDGSRIFLNTATRIVVNYASEARRVNVTGGEALFDVAKRPEWPFIVAAGDRQVTALGTSFVVRKDERRLVVTLVEGKVSVDPILSTNPSSTVSASSEAYTLTPGQRLTFIDGQVPKLDSPPLEESLAWRRGQVVLNETPLSAAAAEMNRYNTLKVIVVHPDVGQIPINGLFQAGDSARFANAVAQAYGLQLRERDGQILLGPATLQVK